MKVTHLGIIMDGNRRWARERGLKPTEGHAKGYKILKELSLYLLLDKKVPFVSAFVFSTENWKRAEEEVGFLMALVPKALNEFLEEFTEKNIRVVFLGRRDKLSDKVLKSLETAEAKTKDNTAGTLALCFNYGGQAEIVDAAKKLIDQKANASILSEEDFAAALYRPEVPPIDLIVRTSGEERISGFMLWRAAYSELIFIDKHWPDFAREDIDNALVEFDKRQRRYGA